MQAEQVILGGSGGIRVELTTYGASIMSIGVPTTNDVVDVVLGYSTAEGYIEEPYYMGATCGRYAGRIDRGKFDLQGELILLEGGGAAESPVLHGGPQGLHSKTWQIKARDDQKVKFGIQSPHGDMGFPGFLDVEVTYRIENESQLAIEYCASCDRPTVINLANHAYFNLNGENRAVDDHVISVNAGHITVLRDDGIPTGAIASVGDSPFDLRTPASLSERLSRLHEARDGLDGFDQNFVLSKGESELGLAATVSAPGTGIALDVFTTQPGLQFYTGDYLAAPFSPRAGLCLEAQNFPDAPNHPEFPSAVLVPGEAYHQRTVYAFREANAQDFQPHQDGRAGLS